MHYYILGKIAEKNDENPIQFLDHYLKAVQFLDSYGAKFPDHISYTTPQLYSIEVLEVRKFIFKYTCKNNILFITLKCMMIFITNQMS